MYIFIFRVDLDLYSIEGIDIRNKCDIAKAECAGQVFAAFKLFFKSIEAFGNLSPRLFNDFRISFCLGLAEFAIELSTSRVEVAIPQILHESCPRSPL